MKKTNPRLQYQDTKHLLQKQAAAYYKTMKSYPNRGRYTWRKPTRKYRNII